MLNRADSDLLLRSLVLLFPFLFCLWACKQILDRYQCVHRVSVFGARCRSNNPPDRIFKQGDASSVVHERMSGSRVRGVCNSTRSNIKHDEGGNVTTCDALTLWLWYVPCRYKLTLAEVGSSSDKPNLLWTLILLGAGSTGALTLLFAGQLLRRLLCPRGFPWPCQRRRLERRRRNLSSRPNRDSSRRHRAEREDSSSEDQMSREPALSGAMARHAAGVRRRGARMKSSSPKMITSLSNELLGTAQAALMAAESGTSASPALAPPGRRRRHSGTLATAEGSLAAAEGDRSTADAATAAECGATVGVGAGVGAGAGAGAGVGAGAVCESAAVAGFGAPTRGATTPSDDALRDDAPHVGSTTASDASVDPTIQSELGSAAVSRGTDSAPFSDIDAFANAQPVIVQPAADVCIRIQARDQ